ncbi:MAG: hypothetical protein KBF68_04500 [Nitrosomonas sp.]|nr:hypothetical protein [Nitrosomonas sp.]
MFIYSILLNTVNNARNSYSLGYTYDWGNPASRVGASEYILSPNSPYQIERIVETAEYCR